MTSNNNIYTLDFTAFLQIGLGVIDILLYLAGLIVVGYIIYGGFQFITSQGEPNKTKQARGAIISALIGLAITLLAVTIVSFLGNSVGGSTNPSQLVTGSLPQPATGQNLIQVILDIVFGIAGAISLLFVVLGGFKYITSGGEPNSITQAKDTILYAIIGLLVSVGAISIVTFVLGKL